MSNKSSKHVLSSFTLDDMHIDYICDASSGAVGLRLLPAYSEHMTEQKDCRVEPLVQLKLVGDRYPGGFSMGRTMRDSESVQYLSYSGQTVSEEENGVHIATTMHDSRRNYDCVHHIKHTNGAPYIVVWSEFINRSDSPLTLEMLSSFTLGGLTPYSNDDAPRRLELYRIHSSWSAEGRLTHAPIEQLHLERSWSGCSAVTTRWGQMGSMPVREYFPLVALEDKAMHVMWGAKLTHAYSWQLEAGRKDDGFSLSGGIADREFGHWTKCVEPGGSFSAPEAILTACEGDADTLCGRLLVYSRDKLNVPTCEENLPVLFNEFCTTWGEPQEDVLCAIADNLKGLGLEYFVIDAGWYAQEPGDWSGCAGSWKVSPFLFKRGLDDTLCHIRSCGMKPGIWFEFEVAGCDDEHYGKTEWLLHRDGVPLSAGARRFWDFCNPDVRVYLHEKVIEFLRRYGFSYIKVDYNDTLGMGVDGYESQGEGLRRQIEAVQDFFAQIRRELPDVVIEVCSSGGHRLVPSFMALASMASFSDAHECEEIPIVAANMHRMILPRQSQIWAVLKPEFDDAMLYYRLTGGLLGRLCLSGPLAKLNEHQKGILRSAIDFYKQSAPAIKDGRTYRYGPELDSWRHPDGWQAIVREGNDRMLCVVHTFHSAPDIVYFPVPEGWQITATCMREGIIAVKSPCAVTFKGLKDLDGAALLLKKTV